MAGINTDGRVKENIYVVGGQSVDHQYYTTTDAPPLLVNCRGFKVLRMLAISRLITNQVVDQAGWQKINEPSLRRNKISHGLRGLNVLNFLVWRVCNLIYIYVTLLLLTI